VLAEGEAVKGGNLELSRLAGQQGHAPDGLLTDQEALGYRFTNHCNPGVRHASKG